MKLNSATYVLLAFFFIVQFLSQHTDGRGVVDLEFTT